MWGIIAMADRAPRKLLFLSHLFVPFQGIPDTQLIIRGLNARPTDDESDNNSDTKLGQRINPKLNQLRPPWRVCEAHLHQAFEYCVIGTIPSKTYGIIWWWQLLKDLLNRCRPYSIHV